jgi:hypothetical protein
MPALQATLCVQGAAFGTENTSRGGMTACTFDSVGTGAWDISTQMLRKLPGHEWCDTHACEARETAPGANKYSRQLCHQGKGACALRLLWLT